MSAEWRLDRGANVGSDGVSFRVWAPSAEQLEVCIRHGSRTTVNAMRRDGSSVFEATIAGLGAGALYGLRIDGRIERPDPVSRSQPAGVHGPSCIVDPAAFAWSDNGWKGRSLEDLALYELHIGTFTPAGTFDGAIERLPELRELGITGIELMPVAEFPGSRNWGYDGVHVYSPQSTYGGPDGLRRLVDAAHRANLAVFLDVVYNHLGPEGNYLTDYGPYLTDRYTTPWGRAVNFDGPDSDEVRRWAIDNALHWITEYHIDGLRLDAVHAIHDESPLHILRDLSDAVRLQAGKLGRRIHVVAESDLNDARLVQDRLPGGHGMDAKWSDHFHHAVHALLTGERQGYYADFGTVGQVADALRDRFALYGENPSRGPRRHDARAANPPADRFVVFVQNHDQTGNRARGERLSVLVGFPQLKLAAALVLLSPNVPLLFMGEEYGETNPFLYFTSHSDRDLVEAVRRGRREEFARFDWDGDVPDPQSENTFERSMLSWDKSPRQRQALLELHASLLRLRRDHAALRPGRPPALVDVDESAGVITLLRKGSEDAWLALFRLTDSRAPVRVPDGRWTLALSTEDLRFMGSGEMPATLDPRSMHESHIPPFSAALYRRTV